MPYSCLSSSKLSDDARGDAQFLRSIRRQPQRFAGRFHARPASPIFGIRLGLGFFVRKVAHFARLRVVVCEQLDVRIDQRREQRPTVGHLFCKRVANRIA